MDFFFSLKGQAKNSNNEEFKLVEVNDCCVMVPTPTFTHHLLSNLVTICSTKLNRPVSNRINLLDNV